MEQLKRELMLLRIGIEATKEYNNVDINLNAYCDGAIFVIDKIEKFLKEKRGIDMKQSFTITIKAGERYYDDEDGWLTVVGMDDDGDLVVRYDEYEFDSYISLSQFVERCITFWEE